ncbi:MAG: acetoacetate--CoA ligase [Saprospiraceae bacterium]|nr:acetoacetate--CoA ligase [Saprospiraceae bacterium]
MENNFEFGKLLWTPNDRFAESSNLTKYRNWLNNEYGLQLSDYEDMHQWSVQNIATFWESIVQYFEVIFHSGYDYVLDDSPMPHVDWFRGGTLNYAEHIFRNNFTTEPAIYFQSEKLKLDFITWDGLRKKVAQFASFLTKKGVTLGDRVVAFIPNIPEATIAFLAANSIGAVWSSCSPDFGAESVIDRFSQISPKVFICADGYYYNGRVFPKWDVISEITTRIDSIEVVVNVPFIGQEYPTSLKDKIVNWDLAIDGQSENLSFTALPFNHPIWVLYSSGTTGVPKAITHSNGGTLLEHLKYLSFHNDVKPGEKFFWYSTTGWMMWNYTNAALLAGASIVLYEGNPAYPDLGVLWKMAEETGLNHFGTSAPYLVSCMRKGIEPGAQFNLQNLRSISSTGSPLPPEAFDWVYKHIKSDIWLCSMSGGTDVCTAFVGGCSIKPVFQGEIQCIALGCDLKVFDDDGFEIINEVGEMVIVQPMPCMPVYFWNDPQFVRYEESYFEMFPGVWRHGDWIKKTPSGSLIIFGRSDATLNRHGIRIGTSEIYSAVNTIPEVKDALVLNLELSGGRHYMPLFVSMNEGFSYNEETSNKICHALKTLYSARHVPDEIILVDDIPYTISGKKMEAPIKKILMGVPLEKAIKLDSMRNPESVVFFQNLMKEKQFK